MRHIRLIHTLAVPFLALLLLTGLGASAYAQDAFEQELRSAYAEYRAVLFHSNTKNAEATTAAINAFSSKWNVLAGKYKSPPPRYANDPAWAKTFEAVALTLNAGRALAEQNKLADAHEAFEKIRDLIEDLHTRNGIVTFSVRMNAFHHQMEEMLKKEYDGFSAAGLGELREDVAVLAYLSQQLQKFPLQEAAGSPDFGATLQVTLGAVSSLQNATRAGDGTRSREALGRLKPAYSKLFLKFG